MRPGRILLVALLVALVTGCSGGPPLAAAPSYSPHNDADVSFATQMINHHEQAVTMSDLMLTKADIDTNVTDLATRIKAAQAPEITQMQEWLTAWGADPDASPAPESGGGMMSESDLKALERATDQQAQQLYLNGMITHHEGAVAMAQTELTDGQSLEAETLAQSIVTSQQEEITEMKRLLGG